MIVTDVMDDLGQALRSIPEMRVFAYGAERVTPPAATVLLPTRIEFDLSAGRGTDKLIVPLIVYVARTEARSTRDLLGPYLDGAGPRSVKRAVEAHTPAAFDVARVANAEPGLFLDMADGKFVGAEFEIHIYGEGGG